MLLSAQVLSVFFFFLMTIVFGNTGYVEHFFLFCGNFMIHIEQSK